MIKKKKSRHGGIPPEVGKKEEGVGLNLGDIGLSFGGLFKGLGEMIDMASQLKEKAGGLKKEGEFKIPVGGKELKGVYGFNISTLADGKPTINTFGTKIKKTPKGPVVEEEREPMVDVFPEKDHILIISELPGVSENEINVELSGDILTITSTGERKYAKEVLLPSPVKPESLKKTYKNGILEIRLEKK